MNSNAWINAVVRSDHNTLYVGGTFTQIGGVGRTGLAEVSLTTGAVTSWNPSLTEAADGGCGGSFSPAAPYVDALAMSAGVLYAGGCFTSVNGSTRYDAAAFSTSTGALTSWDPQAKFNGVSSEVRALALSGSNVYLTGDFNTIQGTTRSSHNAAVTTAGGVTGYNPTVGTFGHAIAVGGSNVFVGDDSTVRAFDTTTGATTSWPRPNLVTIDPSQSPVAYSLLVSGSTLYVGGLFDQVGSAARSGAAAFDTSSGSLLSWSPNVTNASTATCGVTGLAKSGSTTFLRGEFSAIRGITQAGLGSVDATTGAISSWRPTGAARWCSGPWHGAVFPAIDDTVYSPGATLALYVASPSNSVSPSVSGTAAAGNTLTVSNGTWLNDAISYSYQWLRDGNPIAGATAASYTLTTDDIARQVKARVSGQNLAGTVPADSSASTVDGPPVNDTVPSTSGTAQDGQTLTGSDGAWRASPSATVQRFWRRCDSAGNGCADITGATGQAYALTPNDIGRTVRFRVRETNTYGSVTVDSAATALVDGVPQNDVAPTVSGTASNGQTLTGSDGSWRASPSATIQHQWRRCDSTGANCADIGGATAQTYTLTDAEVARTVRLRVTATNSLGSTTVDSAATSLVQGKPVNDAPPVVSGDPTETRTLSVSDGTWRAAPSASFAYQWLRCTSSDVSTCADIVGATSASYTLVRADVGRWVRVRITASNTLGSTALVSDTLGPVATATPVNTTPPSISGTTRDGQTLAANVGSWDGFTPMTFTYAWRRCTSPTDTATCSPISGATQSTYTVTSADVQKYLRIQVTANNSAGSAMAESAATTAVEALPPKNTAAPTVTGTTTDGSLLTSTNGSWTGSAPITFSYQWVRCDDTGSTCADIGGATSNSYRLVSDDVGSRVRIRVTATNESGTSVPASSALSAVIAAVPPANRFSPTITGDARSEATLRASPGTWFGSTPMTFTYQWERCSPLSCSEILGATDQNYTATLLDVGDGLRVRVTAHNAVGTASEYSGTTSPVTPDAPSHPPVTRDLPSISGTAADGNTLTADKGRWVGSEPMVFRYTWQRCDGTDTTGATCTDIAGAAQQTYTLGTDDIGHRIRVAVDATNPVGSARATSAMTGVVAAIPPANTSPPQIAGVARVGLRLQGTDGQWTGSQPIVFSYQWMRCQTDCEEIGGARGDSYTVQPEDAGYMIRLRVVATNPGGNQGAVSGPTATVQ